MHPNIKKAIRTKRNGLRWFRRSIQLLGYLIFDRYSLIVLGILVLGVSVDVVKDLYLAIMRPSNDVEEMLREVEGVSMLFLGIGLILKERQVLRHIFHLSPLRECRLEAWRNRLCAHMGLCLLLNGTAMRLAVQLFKIPDHIIPTQGEENLVFALGLLFCLLASLILLYLLFRLAMGPKVRISI